MARRYQSQAKLTEQPSAPQAGTGLGNLFTQLVGLRSSGLNSQWKLEDEKIQLDLLKGKDPQSAFDRYMQLAEVAGAAGEELASVTFQQKAYSILNAAGSGGGGGRGSGGGGGGSSTSIAEATEQLRTTEKDAAIEAIRIASERIKAGDVTAQEGFDEIANALLTYTQKASDLYAQFAASGASKSKLEQLAQEADITLAGASKSDAGKAIQKALKENLYGDTIPSGTDTVEMFSSHLSELQQNPNARLLLVPKAEGKKSLSQTLSGRQKGPDSFDVQIADSSIADENDFAPVNRVIGSDRSKDQEIWIRPTNVDEYNKISEQADKDVQDGIYASKEEALADLLSQQNFRLNFDVPSVDDQGNVYTNQVAFDPNPNSYTWEANGNVIGQGTELPAAVAGNIIDPAFPGATPASAEDIAGPVDPRSVEDVLKIQRSNQPVSQSEQRGPVSQLLLGRDAQAKEANQFEGIGSGVAGNVVDESGNVIGESDPFATSKIEAEGVTNQPSQLQRIQDILGVNRPERAVEVAPLNQQANPLSNILNTIGRRTQDAVQQPVDNFQNVIDSIKQAARERSQQEQQVRELQAPAPVPFEAPSGLRGSVGARVFEPVPRETQRRSDPLEIRRQASLAATKGFNAFKNFFGRFF